MRLAQALLPVLLHELNNHTQYLSALAALGASGDALPDSGAGLAETATDVDDLGWLLGLCAGGHGTDLLRDRTERRGLAPLVRLLRKALRREGRDLERADRDLPDLAPRLGWRGAWRVARVLHACAGFCSGALAWDLEADGDDLVLTCAVAASPFDAESLPPAVVVEPAKDLVRFRIVARGPA